jgi:exonuclease III
LIWKGLQHQPGRIAGPGASGRLQGRATTIGAGPTDLPLRITTWNVNSVRLRLEGLGRLVREVDPDVLCLQETKVRNDLFPVLELRALGFAHHVLHGQAGYHGVAIFSKLPLEGATPSSGTSWRWWRRSQNGSDATAIRSGARCCSAIST